MLDMGFIHDIKRILEQLPAERQTLLFSATFSSSIRRLAADLLRDPESVDVAPRNATPTPIRQLVHPVDKARKRHLLAHMVRDRGHGPGAGLHAHQARRQPARRAARQGRHPRHRHPRQQEPVAARARPGGLQEGRGAGAGGHRRRRPRAGHRRLSRTWSTTSCPRCPRTTCTASAAPVARARKARPSRWSRVMNASS